MIITTTMLGPIKGSVRDFLYASQDENRAEIVQSGGEISWEASSTKPKDSLLLRFIPMVRFFTPYRPGGRTHGKHSEERRRIRKGSPPGAAVRSHTRRLPRYHQQPKVPHGLEQPQPVTALVQGCQVFAADGCSIPGNFAFLRFHIHGWLPRINSSPPRANRSGIGWSG